MSAVSGSARPVYMEPPSNGRPPLRLVLAGAGEECAFVFYDRIEIGRLDEAGTMRPGALLVPGPAVSSRHCIVTQMQDGRCVVRDVSRNGTRLEERRLVPNIEAEIRAGQTITVGDFTFRLEKAPDAAPAPALPRVNTTRLDSGCTHVTVLVGDLRDYTVMVRTVDPVRLQQAVSRLFARLEAVVTEFGGTVKEYQGDAIFAFWERKPGGGEAIQACRAAQALHRRAEELARDPSVWDLSSTPLRMDWALASGPVTIQTIGGDTPTGLSMIGEAVVLAFRLEKFADDETGPILVCRNTKRLTGSAFTFRDLGEKQAKGFARPDRVFALESDPGEPNAG